MPFLYGTQSVTERRGFLLKKSFPGGALFAEASPLLGHSADTLAQVEDSLASSTAHSLLNDCVGLPPSLRFAVESFSFLATPGKYPVRSNALLRWEGREETRARLQTLIAGGYTHCKLKLSAENWEEQIRLLADFPQTKFRLDANRALSPATVEKIITHLLRASLTSRVDYFEEPFAGIWSEKSFSQSPVPFAADESVLRAENISPLLESPNSPAVFVIKPTVMGGLSSLSELAKALRNAGKRCVFTSALETEPARRALIAFLSTQPAEVAGLSTGFIFAENFLADQSTYPEAPVISPEERAHLDALSWKDCP